LNQVDNVRLLKNDLRKRIKDSINESSLGGPLTLEELTLMIARIKELTDELRVIENTYKEHFKHYISYKHDADTIKDFERVIELLVKDNPVIEKSIQRLKDSETKFDVLITEGL
jgi:hypothetical protein